jgi:hypothetical protein
MYINPIGASIAVRSIPSSNINENDALGAVSNTPPSYNQNSNMLFSATNINKTGILTQNVIQTLQDFGVDNTRLSIDENVALQHFILNLYNILTSVDTNNPTDAGLTNMPIDLAHIDLTNSANDTAPVDSTNSANDTAPVDSTNSANDTAPVDSTNLTNDTAPVDSTNSANDTAPVDSTNLTNDTAPVDSTNSANETAPVDSTNLTNDTAPVDSTNLTNDTAPVDSTNSANETAPVDSTNLTNDTALFNDSANSNSINAYNNSNSNLQIIIGEVQKITELNLNFDNLLQTLNINSDSINLLDFLRVLNSNIDNSYSSQNKGYLISVTA